jgi:cytochrome c5
VRPLSIVALVAILACDDPRADRAKPAPSARSALSAPTALAPADEARAILQSRCAACHGALGKGDGPSSATLNPRPRDFTSKEWQKTMSDGQLRSVIVKGGVVLGKSPLMPPNPDLESKPAVVDELVKLVRGFGQ